MRPTVVVLGAVLAAIVAVPSASSKEDARARLLTALPLDAAPGTTIRVSWTVDVPNGKGGRAPFGAQQMFVRLLSRTGAATTTAFTNTTAGVNTAEARVPQDGIGGVRVGLRGTTDILFPLANDPFRSARGTRCDVAALRATLAAFVRAYNRGDARRLDRLFSRLNFVWYSSTAPGKRLFAEASRRGTLIAYFLRRHRHRDTLALRSYRFNGYDRTADLGHFELRAQRRADDFAAGGWFDVVAKGALDCSRPRVTIAALSLG